MSVFEKLAPVGIQGSPFLLYSGTYVCNTKQLLWIYVHNVISEVRLRKDQYYGSDAAVEYDYYLGLW